MLCAQKGAQEIVQFWTTIIDQESRKQIIQIHTKRKPIADDVNIDKLATKMDGYTGADIAAIASAAVLLSLREDISK